MPPAGGEISLPKTQELAIPVMLLYLLNYYIGKDLALPDGVLDFWP